MITHVHTCEKTFSRKDVVERYMITNSQSRPLYKCDICKKKLGLMPLRCRCKRYFCALHRYAEDHECDYDYKTVGKEKIRKENPKIVAEKIIRI